MHVEHVRMGLLDLVEQHHGVRPAADRLGQLTALVVADVAGRGHRPGGRRSASRRTRSCRCGPSPARRRTGSRPAPWPARSCPRRSGRGTKTSRSAGWGRRRRPGCAGPRRRRPARPCAGRRPACRVRPPCAAAWPSRPRAAGPAGMPVHDATHIGDVVGPDLLLEHHVGLSLRLGQRGVQLLLHLRDAAVPQLGGLREVAVALGPRTHRAGVPAPRGGHARCRWRSSRSASAW